VFILLKYVIMSSDCQRRFFPLASLRVEKTAGFQEYVIGFKSCPYRFFINHLPFNYFIGILLIIIHAKLKINSWNEAPTI